MPRANRLTALALPALCCLMLTSCDNFYFARPQPADKRDERSIAGSLQGEWYDITDNEEIAPDVIRPDSLHTVYGIDRNRIWIYESNEVKLLDRILTLADAETDRKLSRAPFLSRRIERLNSNDGHVDTIDNFILQGERIHPIEEDRLRQGFPFRRMGDTIAFLRRDTTCLELGHHVKIRKAAKDLYVLNFRDGISREARDWWSVLLVRPAASALDIYAPGKKMAKHPARFLERNDDHYLDLDIRAEELEGMIRDSLFVQSMRLVRE